MKYYKETKRVGEWLNLPIDWEHEFFKDMSPTRFEMLKVAEKEPDKFEATTDTGCPKIGWGSILSVGMYDGWPYWKPCPAIQISGTYGVENVFVSSICGIRLKTD